MNPFSVFTQLFALAPMMAQSPLTRTRAASMGLKKKRTEADLDAVIRAEAKRERRAKRNAANPEGDASTRKALSARGVL